MKRLVISPIFRLSIGLSLLTVSLLLVADFLGFIPNQKHAEFTARKAISESLAVQVSADVVQGKMDSVTAMMHSLQERNESILSVGLRTIDNRLISSAGEHIRHWRPLDKGLSTVTHIQVPIHNNSGRWGTLEVSFKPLGGNFPVFIGGGSIITIILFIAISGFVAYWLFLKRALNELDPSAVVPDRVRAALNILAEGLVILDTSGRIVFVNTAFEQKLGQPAQTLIGKKLSALDWQAIDTADSAEPFILPWQLLLDGIEAKPSQLKLFTMLKEHFSFAVNIAPIQAPDGKIRGVVVTFDDITELEHKNTDLERALGRIKHSQQEITRQNRELQVLATRDPLTGLLNRRSLFEGFATLLSQVEDEGETLSCIMLDIDHFKSVNDRFGHATGDIVIKLLAKILIEEVRRDDLVGRYGGEEFCVVLPDTDEQRAAYIAERMRLVVEEVKYDQSAGTIPFTASFGVSSLIDAKSTPEFIINNADKALYHAKESGRNQVACWSVVEHLENTDKHEVQDSVQKNPAIISEPELLSESDRAESFTKQQLHHRIAELEAAILAQSSSRDCSRKVTNDFPSQIVLIDRIKQGIERSQRLNTLFAVLFIDVDTLQVIRNTLGELAADKLAKLLGGRLKKTLRSADSVVIDGIENIGSSVSRNSSGEFVVLLMDMQRQGSATWVMQRMFTAMNESVQLEGTEVFLDVRIGASVYPTDGKDPDTLLSHAGIALREAKSTLGRDICLYYSKEMNEHAKSQLHMKGELHRAVERNELFIEYQPVISMNTGRIASFEALLRWHHPQFGLVSPESFISIAENAGLIENIGNWVLENACRQLKAWHDLGHENLTMAVNFSAVQFRNPGFVKKVTSIVEHAGLMPTSLTLEITESALIQNLDITELTLNELSNAGMRISLDDFGTGYSSLSYLKHFPIDIVKIDKSFLRGFPEHAHDSAIVSAIIAMVHSLGLHVVAEGVEVNHQLQALQNLNCDSIQGYLFSKPIAREQATALLCNPSDIRRRVWDTRVGDSQVENIALAGVINNAPKRDSVA